MRRHVAWARSTIPWFGRRLRPTDRLQDLEPLTRADLQTHRERLRDPTRPESAFARQASGGSTGEPVVVYQDQAYRSWDHALEAWWIETWELEPWCRAAFVWGSDRDLATLSTRERTWLRLLRRRVVNAFAMDEKELSRIADDLERFRPVLLQGYASALDLLASWWLANRPDRPLRPQLVRSSAEALAPDVRARIERAFDAPVADFYGSRESASLAAECPAGSLHVQAALRHLEIVDDQGRATAPGERGRILVTDLRNHAFGLLRYEIGDVGAWGPPGPCPCGCPWPRIERVWGRTSDFLTTPGGERVHGEWFTHLFYGRDDVRRFQVVQPARDEIVVRTVGPATAEDLAGVIEQIRARFGPTVAVTWERRDAIEPTAAGKRRFTISEVPWRAGSS